MIGEKTGHKVASIMLIDDDEINNFICETIIKKADVTDEILIYSDARQALDYLDKDNNSDPDLIFLDINMPGMDGFRFLDEYYKLGFNESKKTKVCILSSSVHHRDKDRARGYDIVVDYITKPLTSDAVRKAVEKI